MATYLVTKPDGTTYKIDQPDDAPPPGFTLDKPAAPKWQSAPIVTPAAGQSAPKWQSAPVVESATLPPLPPGYVLDQPSAATGGEPSNGQGPWTKYQRRGPWTKYQAAAGPPNTSAEADPWAAFPDADPWAAFPVVPEEDPWAAFPDAPNGVPPPPPGFTEPVRAARPPPPPGFTEPVFAAPTTTGAAPAPDGVDPYALNYDIPREVLDGTATYTEPAPPGVFDNLMRSALVDLQGIGRGAAEFAGMPVDLMTAAVNLGGAGVNWATGTEIPSIDRPFLGSEMIADTASDGAQMFGLDLIDPDEMTGLEKAGYNTGRFGTQAALGGLSLLKAATADALPPILAKLGQPYKQNGARTLTRDITGGAGMGLGLTAAEEAAPGWLQGTTLDIAGMIAGGVAGAATPSILSGGARKMVERLERIVSASQGLPSAADDAIGVGALLTPDPETGLVPSRKTANRAAAFVQSNTSDPDAAAETIRRRAGEFVGDGLPTPTTGQLADDVGLASLEKGFRQRDPSVFGQQDASVMNAAREPFDQVAAGADPRAATGYAGRVADARLETAQRAVDKAQGELTGVQRSSDAAAADLGSYRGQGDEASRQIDQQYRAALQSERSLKNQLFDAPVLAGEMVSLGRLQRVAQDIVDGTPATAGREALPTDIIADLQSYGEGATISFAEMQALRPRLATAMQAANSAGNGALVRNLTRLRTALDDEAIALSEMHTPAGDAVRRALDNYANRYAPRFVTGEGGKLRKDIARDPTGVATRPTDTAARFLSAPEAAADLARVLETAPNRLRGLASARTWLLDRMASSAILNRDGQFNYNALVKWRDANAGVLDQIPGLRGEVDSLVDRVSRGAGLTDRFSTDLRAARDRLAATGHDLRGSAVRHLVGADPANAVAGVFSSRDPLNAMREVVSLVGRNDDAREGWKRAVSEHMLEKAKAPRGTAGVDTTLDPAKLDSLFEANEHILAEVFSPEEMNLLQRARKLLGPAKSLNVPANTARPDSSRYELLSKAVELGLRGMFGAVEGGSKMRQIRLTLSTVPQPHQAVERLVARMFFDPELAAHLLTREVPVRQGKAWNAKLLRLLGYGELARGEEG
jgi:hypothetical protein